MVEDEDGVVEDEDGVVEDEDEDGKELKREVETVFSVNFISFITLLFCYANTVINVLCVLVSLSFLKKLPLYKMPVATKDC